MCWTGLVPGGKESILIMVGGAEGCRGEGGAAGEGDGGQCCSDLQLTGRSPVTVQMVTMFQLNQ